MLKLTNSCCRYLTYNCENINNSRTNVNNIVYLMQKSQICSNIRSVLNTQIVLSCVRPSVQYRLYSNAKKRYRPKKQVKDCNEPKTFKQMSEPLKPTPKFVSCGGHFEVSSDSDSTTGSEWIKSLRASDTISGSGSTNSTNRKETGTIPPDFRVWEQVLNGTDNIDNGKHFKFKILSYNVLAQYLLECHPYLYTECAPYNLKWKVRAAKLYDEIVNLAPDIICLQEVQASHLESFYSKFEDIGYFGIFKQKTGQRQDGCAIYFKQALFDMRDHVTIEYYQPGLPILNRDNIGIMAKLMPKNYQGPPIVIATTHLLYNPKRTDVRLAQIQVLLAEIDRFAYYHNGHKSGHLPIILTGDFNSTPDSAVITLLDRGCVRASSLRDTSDWQKIEVTDNCQHLSVYLNRQEGRTTDFCMTKINNTDYRDTVLESSQLEDSQHRQLFNSSIISHSLNFTSTYTKYKPDGCLEATTFQDYWVTVDYIYFSYCSTLRLVERLRLPTSSECDVLGRLPNDAYGSDHLALVAIFELKSCNS